MKDEVSSVPVKVTVLDVNMSFLSMANFMVKWFFASILAATVVFILSLPLLIIVLFILAALGN